MEPEKKLPFYKKHKKALLISSGLLLLIVLYFITLKKSGPGYSQGNNNVSSDSINQWKNVNSTLNTGTIPDDKISITPGIETKQENHYATMFPDIKTPVLDYSWEDKILIYATKDGIYKAENPSPIIGEDISYINFNQKADAVLLSNGEYFGFSGKTNTQKQLSIRGKFPIISYDGNLIASYDSQSIYLKNVSTEEDKNTDINKGISKLIFNPENNNIIVETKDRHLMTFNDHLDKKQDITSDQDFSILGISPDGTSLAYQKGNKIVISSLNLEKMLEVEFDSKNTLAGNWIGNNEFIVMERYSTPMMVYTDIWEIKSPNKKVFLFRTIPIPQDIITTVTLKPNSDNIYIPLIEDGQGIWLLGLQENIAPIYSQSKDTYQYLPYSQYSD